MIHKPCPTTNTGQKNSKRCCRTRDHIQSSQKNSQSHIIHKKKKSTAFYKHVNDRAILNHIDTIHAITIIEPTNPVNHKTDVFLSNKS